MTLTIVRGQIVSPEENPIKNGALVIEGNTIIAKGEFSQITKDYDSGTVVGDQRSIVIPGFVNTHSHAVQTFFRGAADDKALLEWLNDVILPGEANLLPNEVYSSCRIGYAEMLLSGITTTNDMLTGNHSLQGMQAAVDSGIRARVGKMLMDRNVPEEMLGETNDILEEAVELSERYPAAGRIQFSFTPRFILTCSDELMKTSSLEAQDRGLMFHTHAAENIAEGDEVYKLTGKTYINAIDDLRGLGRHSILAHCVHTDSKERSLLAETGTNISHNPSSNSKLASGIAPIPDYMNRGINVGLATDGSPAGGGHNFFLEMRLASFLQTVISKNPEMMKAKEVFHMATLGGAKALNLHDVGKLDVGYKADITVLNPVLPSAYPMYNPYSYIVYTATPRDVSTVIVDGTIQVQKGQIQQNLKNHFEEAEKYVSSMN